MIDKPRMVHLISFELVCEPPASAQLVINPWKVEHPHTLPPGKTWWSLQAGDRIETPDGIRVVKHVQLWRVDPAEYSGQIVKNAISWASGIEEI